MERKTKVDFRILIVTLCVALCLITAGIMLDTSGKKSASNATSTDGTLTLDSFWSMSTSSGKTLKLAFTPSSSGWYDIMMDNARVVSVKNVYGNEETLYEPTDYYAYDECRSVYLSSGQKYFVTIKATGSLVRVKVSR